MWMAASGKLFHQDFAGNLLRFRIPFVAREAQVCWWGNLSLAEFFAFGLMQDRVVVEMRLKCKGSVEIGARRVAIIQASKQEIPLNRTFGSRRGLVPVPFTQHQNGRCQIFLQRSTAVTGSVASLEKGSSGSITEQALPRFRPGDHHMNIGVSRLLMDGGSHCRAYEMYRRSRLLHGEQHTLSD